MFRFYVSTRLNFCLKESAVEMDQAGPWSDHQRHACFLRFSRTEHRQMSVYKRNALDACRWGTRMTQDRAGIPANPAAPSTWWMHNRGRLVVPLSLFFSRVFFPRSSCRLILTVDMEQACSSWCLEGLWYRVGMVSSTPHPPWPRFISPFGQMNGGTEEYGRISILSGPPTVTLHPCVTVCRY